MVIDLDSDYDLKPEMDQIEIHFSCFIADIASRDLNFIWMALMPRMIAPSVPCLLSPHCIHDENRQSLASTVTLTRRQQGSSAARVVSHSQSEIDENTKASID